LGFETGDISEWGNCTEVPDNATDGLQVVTSPVIQGQYSLKAYLNPGDFDAQTNGSRAEVKYCSPALRNYYFVPGDDIWYHWYTMFPENFTIPRPADPTWWITWTQWHGALGGGKFGLPVAFNLNGDKLNLRVNGSHYDKIGCYNITTGHCGYHWVEQPLQTGKWYEILIHIVWSNTTNGLVEGWVNGMPIAPYSGVTLSPSEPEDAKVYLKQGIYRNRNTTLTQSIYHDGMEIVRCPSDSNFYHPDTNSILASSILLKD
jgi:hypothetical protein